MVDTLYNHPILGSGGALGGWIGSILATTPIFQFLAAFTGSVIGMVTLWGLLQRLIKWISA